MRRSAAPPHSRGWTPERVHSGAVDRGSPAPAGMDPLGRGSRPGRRGLPRTRGDGPEEPSGLIASILAPPHPRGWTRVDFADVVVGRGSPAPAGMDPHDPAGRGSGPRLPRTRGDGPVPSVISFGPRSAPPHPRGWTRDRRDDRGVRRGSPAPAGMDPEAADTMARLPRLPRTHGDGPHLVSWRARPRGAPPHPRGWTLTG